MKYLVIKILESVHYVCMIFSSRVSVYVCMHVQYSSPRDFGLNGLTAPQTLGGEGGGGGVLERGRDRGVEKGGVVGV